ncbi:sensor histidine kinase [Streptomyces sp. NPDC057702]|uniref:sensor histidine kinase n=1 Tax=unclassified Streptomyces TaxID=2593676 RepID=UPI0036CD8111
MNGTDTPSPVVVDGTTLAPEARPARRRSARDWAVDISACVLAALFSFMTAETVVEDPDIPELVIFVDLLLGVLGCLGLWLRRRWPTHLAVALMLVSPVSHFVVGPSLVAVFSVAVYRPLRPVAAVAALGLADCLLGGLVHTDPDLGYVGSVLTGAVLYSTALGWGMFVRSRRQLVLSLQERAHRAETEAALRAERAQRLTRERIAREMHDVLAHRLSLLSVHAGALEYRPDAPSQDVAQAAGVIRASAHQALEDLREVIGVLRAPIGQPAPDQPAPATAEPPAVARPATTAPATTERPATTEPPASAVPSRPQPTLADLPRLVEESRQAAMRVALHDERDESGQVPAATGRTAYRVVQEGLTNARKHAPGAAVSVRVSGAPAHGLTVEVRDRPRERGAGQRGAASIPGSGQGLVGLTERASLAGGRLESGVAEDGGFLLRAWLPWPS